MKTSFNGKLSYLSVSEKTIIFLLVTFLVLFIYVLWSRYNTSTHSSKQGASSNGEEATRLALKELTGKPFNKDRPSWLVNPSTNRCLELDCYDAELKIAVEYDGQQHYNHVKAFTDKNGFYKQLERDKIKEEACRKRNILLIRVPYWEKDIKGYLKAQLIAYGKLMD